MRKAGTEKTSATVAWNGKIQHEQLREVQYKQMSGLERLSLAGPKLEAGERKKTEAQVPKMKREESRTPAVEISHKPGSRVAS
jgi:hypothetical protein